MKSRTGILFLFLLLSLLFNPGERSFVFGQKVVKQGGPVPASFCVKPTEMELYQMVCDDRAQHGLPPIPLSKSLCYVAAQHLKDLFLHHPDEGSCNFHSWSAHGPWKPFCYPVDENKKNSVWDKPREITRYPAKAYEIIYWENNPVLVDTIMSVWESEEYFNSFLVNSGKWLGVQWNAIGIAIYENYACAWFGEVKDPEGKPEVCGNQSLLSKKPVPAKPADSLQKNKSKSVAAGKKSEKKQTEVLKGIPSAAVDKSSTAKDSLGLKPITYYIIVRTNISEENAMKLITELQTKGYPDARFLDKDGKSRVSVFQSNDRAEVMAKLREVKKSYKDAWLLKNQ